METEVKILEIDPEQVIATLQSCGAKRLFDGLLRSVFFDRETSLRDSGTTLRVRTDGGECVVAVKVLCASDEYKQSEEYEFSGSFDDALAALRALGFEEYARSEKHRSSYRLGGVRVDIDRLLDDAFVPPFLELEGEPNEIDDTIIRLGLREHMKVSWTGYELRQHYTR